MLNVGRILQDRYEIVGKIGSGGMADVYKAKDHRKKTLVAVKVLKAEFRADETFVAKFREEAQAVAGLEHPNIVSVYDTGEEAGIQFIIMELVEGITLKEYIEKKEKLGVREATSISLQISAGLEAAHNRGVVHRDVKPQNIIISTDGKVKVADFGIARAVTSNTISSSVMGSVHYTSPEQARGGYSDAKSDIYSLGICMYEMLTGQVPFNGETTVAIALKHLQEEIRSPKELVPELPTALVNIILKCTQKSPDRRYANMGELIQDLRESLIKPEGDFVVMPAAIPQGQTVLISREELDEIRQNLESSQEKEGPAYDENINVGAAAGLTPPESEPQQAYAHTPGSYYQASSYRGSGWQESYPSHYPTEHYVGSYYDEDEPEPEPEPEKPERRRRKKGSDEPGINPGVERAITIGSVVVAVVLGFVFLGLIANTFDLFNFGGSSRKRPAAEQESEEQTGAVLTEQESGTESETETAVSVADAVPVPKILGKKEAEAKVLLGSQQLGAKYLGEKASDEYEKGTIMEQEPAEGELVPEGTSIGYVISAGSEKGTVPDVIGYSKEDGQQAITQAGFNCKSDSSQYSNEIPAGCVIGTSPMPGAELEKGETVIMYISQGPGQTEQVMPPLIDYPQTQAEAILNELEVGVEIQEEASSEIKAGNVIRQSVEAGTVLNEGMTVILTVSTGPEASAEGEAVWRCRDILEEPEGYNGQYVKIELEQGGETTEVYEGYTSFPYTLDLTGTPGVETGVVYVYLMDPASEEYSTKVKYEVTFKQVEE